MNYKELFEENRKKIKKIIKLVTKEDNEDLEQEVYIRAYQNKDKYKEDGKLLNWLSTIAYNVSKNYLKKAQTRYETNYEDDGILNEMKDKTLTPEEKILQKERQKTIIDAINSLNKKHKEVILMSEVYNISYEEISNRLKCPMGTVKSRIYNAKKELYNILKDII